VELPSFFSDFLQDIRPTPNQRSDARTGHETLRKRLLADERLSPIIVSTFLQGSYRRATAIRPGSDGLLDVDVVAVTKLDRNEYPYPADAMALFIPFLDEHYEGKYKPQGRSFGITLSYVHLDLVIASAPSESEWGILKAEAVATNDTLEEATDWRLSPSWLAAEHRTAANAALLEKAVVEPEWKLSPLYIPDREARCWQPTHPLAQMTWTRDKNARCNRHYVNVVKALKWWRHVNHPSPEYPKGYPVEHMIGHCCPDGITSVAQGVTLALEQIASEFAAYAALKSTPDLRDHGVDQNVLGRVSGANFAQFHAQVCDAAKIARAALDATDKVTSAREWRRLFGCRFPEPADGTESRSGFSPQESAGGVIGGRFA
jgi:hypothetical protein